jgi:hypothetical protein
MRWFAGSELRRSTSVPESDGAATYSSSDSRYSLTNLSAFRNTTSLLQSPPNIE